MKLSKLLRFMLYDTAKSLISIDDELKMLEDYIDLEKIRYNDKLTLSFLKDITDKNEHISPLLLLPFVENAFKHVSRNDGGENVIHISSQVSGEFFHFRVSNTFDNHMRANQAGGIGLQNVRRRLDLIYPQRHSLDIRKENGVHTLDFKLNVH